MKFIAYYRVSTDKQGESGLGLEAQQQICYAYARAEGAEIVAEFTDIESGSHNHRPELLKALALLDFEKDQFLLVAKQCRLTRSVHLMSDLLEKKVPLVIAETPKASIFELHIRAVLNEETRRQISINTKNALRAAKARGIQLGAPRDKLKEIGTAGGNRRAYHTAQYALSIKQWVDIAIQQADKPTCVGIAKKLNELGIKTYLNRQWTGSNVQWYFNTIKERERKYGGETDSE